MLKRLLCRSDESGFTLVEVVLACVIFPLIVVGLTNIYGAVQSSYTTAKELNEMYAVLSACPEIDRALEYDSVTGATNCFPNNIFQAEGGGSGTFTYAPTLTVTSTPSLPVSDPLQTVPDSKVIDIQVGFLHNPASRPLELRMLITRNGIGQQ